MFTTAGFLLILNHHKVLVYFNSYAMGLRSLEIFYFFQCRRRLYTSESDVCRRQILTHKDGRHTEKVIIASRYITK